jgi:hypothetical protein
MKAVGIVLAIVVTLAILFFKGLKSMRDTEY